MDVSTSIVIVTRNRKKVLRSSLDSALAQRPSVPVIVVDDASSDGTEEMISKLYPKVIYHKQKSHTGCPGSRNVGLSLVETPIAVLIDDDAVFQDTSTVAGVVSDFDHPKIAAVAMPFEEENRLVRVAPSKDGIYLTNYCRGCAHALRKEIVLENGGYRAELGFYVEEPDLCIRLLHRGYVTRLGRTPPVRHFPNIDRQSGLHELSQKERTRRLLRNETLFKWWHTPTWYLVPVLAHHVARCMGRRRGAESRLLGLKSVLDAFLFVWKTRQSRSPVSHKTYLLWRTLSNGKPVTLEEVADAL